MPVTNLKVLANRTNYSVEFLNREHAADNKQLPPRYTWDNNAMWIPWCDSDADLKNGKYIEVVIMYGGPESIFIFQHDGSIWYNRQRAFASKVALGPDAREGGEKTLSVEEYAPGNATGYSWGVSLAGA